MEISIYNFPEKVKGNTFPAKKITFPFEITGACITMQFKRRADGVVEFQWSTEDASIEVLSSTEVSLKTRVLDYPVYNYVYDCVVTFPDGITVVTYFKGEFPIIQNTSQGCQI